MLKMLKAERRIKERISPSIFSWYFLVLNAILKDIKGFSKLIKTENYKKILDLGCGVKPYRSLFKDVEDFVGFDIEDDEGVDRVGVNWDLPFDDNEFDGLISTQVLEHTAKIPETIKEIKRVVKKNGLVFISVPFVFPIHGAPYDYYRFTKFGLMEVFKEFDIIEIKESSGYIATQFRMFNVFLNFIPLSKYFFFPIYFINNITGLFVDWLAKIFFGLFGEKGNAVYESNYLSLPENYSIILRNKK